MFPIQSGTDDAATLYVDDVFSTYLYTGNGSTQTITNGIDLAGKGGMVWIKRRDGATGHALYDSARASKTSRLSSETTGAETGVRSDGISSFNSNGFSLNSDLSGYTNSTSLLYTSWTFRKAPKFFDVVTYTGDGATWKTLTHSLTSTPGTIIVKATSATQDWHVYHRSLTGANVLKLNTTDAQLALGFFQNIGASTFDCALNTNGASYVAYLFAHDPSADGIIQCGSFTTDASGNATVNLGWEPQYLMIKRSDSTGNWFLLDTARGITHSNSTAYLWANSSQAEANTSGYLFGAPTPTGFTFGGGIGTNATHIYLAIRRSNKPPTSGTQVFQPVTYTGDGAGNRLVNTGLLTDLFFGRKRNGSGTGYEGMVVGSRLTGDYWMKTALTQAETLNAGVQTPTSGYGNTFSAMNGFGLAGTEGPSSTQANLNGAVTSYIAHAFKRAKGFMDVVCYTGAGVARTVPHGLGAVPELMIIKCRNAAQHWPVYHVSTSSGGGTYLSLSDAYSANSALFNSTAPTASVFSVGASAITNSNTNTYEAILFATLPGISKVGTVSVGLSDVNVDCGFTTGARYVLLKRLDNSSDWYVFDTARGIVVGNDPVLFLNTSGYEISSSDTLAPYSAGFTIKYAALGNANWIYLAIA